MSRKIFIIEPHPVHRESYAFLIDRQDDLDVCGVGASLDQAEQAFQTVMPDLAVVTLSAQAMDEGIRRISMLHVTYPTLPLLVVSACSTDACAQAVREAGAIGYLTRDRVPFDLTSCIRTALHESASPSSSFGVAA